MRCGSSEVRSRGRSTRCGSCDFEFFFNTAGAVAGIIECDHGLLVTRRAHNPAQGTLDLPGGFIDYEETAEDALRREVDEELSIELLDPTYAGSYPNRYHYSGFVVHTVDLVFRCRPVDLRTLRVAPNEDVSEALVVPINELEPDQFGLSSIRKIVADYMRGVL